MNLNRNNYEEFFLLYVDNELPDAERKAVEAFLRQNPDLEGELSLLQGTKMKPESDVFFKNKELLLKHDGKDAFVNLSNYQEIFVLYIDGELSMENRKMVEDFASQDPFLQKELISFQLARIEPDESLVFEGKEILFRAERRIFLWPRIGIAAAAILIIAAGYYAFTHGDTAKPVNIKKQISEVVAAPKKSVGENREAVKKDQSTVTPKTVEPLYKTDRLKSRSKMENKNQPERVDPKSEELPQTFTPENLNPTMEIAKINEPVIGSVRSPMTLIVAENNDKFPVADHNSAPDIHADPEDGIDQASAPESKNKMRGLFRKVSRVFEKTTSASEDKSKHGILIGGFQIALK